MQSSLPTPTSIIPGLQGSLPSSAQPVISKAKPRKGSERVNCPQCGKEYAQSTLTKNGGICGKCKGPSNPSTKGECHGCHKPFTLQTLTKNGGTCAKCKTTTKMPNEMVVNAPLNSVTTSDKALCQGTCGKSYTLTTLKKNGGKCARCKKEASASAPSVPSISNVPLTEKMAQLTLNPIPAKVLSIQKPTIPQEVEELSSDED